MALDPNLAQGGFTSIAVTVIYFIVRNLKFFIKISQSQWERNVDGWRTRVDGLIDDFSKESATRRADFVDLKKNVIQSLAKMETQVEQIVKVVPVIAAIKGFVENTNKRLNAAETEVIKLSEELRLIRDKKKPGTNGEGSTEG